MARIIQDPNPFLIQFPKQCPFSLSDFHSNSQSNQASMEVAGRAMNLASRVINNHVFVDVCLGGCFFALGVRSFSQQRDIETLEAEKQALIQSNKALKKSIWDSKQALYAEASLTDSPILPLAKIKAIYGEVVAPVPAVSSKDVEKDKASSSQQKLLI